jgi:flagellar biogenesis protein FliO
MAERHASATRLFIALVRVLAIIGLSWVARRPQSDDHAVRPSSAVHVRAFR